MSIARQGAAARKGIVTIVTMLAMLSPAAWADSGPQLILPLVTAIAVATTAARAPQRVATMTGRRPVLSLLPAQLQIEDGYEIDVEDYIGRRRPVALADVDRIVSYDLLQQRRDGWMTSFVYDEDSRGPLSPKGEILRLIVDYRF
jgi:hypothetical protein